MSNVKKARSAAPYLVLEAAFTVGVVLLALVLLIALAGLALRLAGTLGFDLYAISTESAPSLWRDGALVHAEALPPEEVRAGSYIAFEAGGSVGVLRVRENLIQEARFTADGPPGDDNLYSIPYAALLGRATMQLPVLGLLAGNPAYTAVVALCALILLALLLWLRRRSGDRLYLRVTAEALGTRGVVSVQKKDAAKKKRK